MLNRVLEVGTYTRTKLEYKIKGVCLICFANLILYIFLFYKLVLYKLLIANISRFSFKIWYKSPYVQSFVNGSALNPNCAISVHLSYNVRAIIFVFCFVEDTILNKKDFMSHGVIKIDAIFIFALIILIN